MGKRTVVENGPGDGELHLRLERESKLVELVDGAAGHRLEASGVLVKDGCFYVIFDNLPHIARLSAGLAVGASENRLFPQERREADGFEDIAYDPSSDRFFILIEALQRRPGLLQAKVHQYDADLRFLRSDWLDFPLDSLNKGLEGLTCVHRDGRTWLLALCEGNRGRGGKAGRRPGGGRIEVFGETDAPDGWVHADTIRLPSTLPFADYSSVSIDGDRIAVVSQESAALWLGRLCPSGTKLVDDGIVYRFPADPDGRTGYRSVEGVAWLGDDRLVMVSDKVKSDGEDRSGEAKEQSIHIFGIPVDGPCR